MLLETDWLDMFILLQVVGGAALVALMWAARRKDEQ